MCEEKITKINLQINENEISFHLSNNLRLQVVRARYTQRYSQNIEYYYITTKTYF